MPPATFAIGLTSKRSPKRRLTHAGSLRNDESIITSLIGDLTASARVETDGLNGEVSLAIK